MDFSSSFSSINNERRSLTRSTDDTDKSLSHIATSLRFAPVPIMAIAGLLPQTGMLGDHKTLNRLSHLRASYHGKTDKSSQETFFLNTLESRKPFGDVIGSAESLIGKVLYEQGLGKYCDPSFVRVTQQELAEAVNLTQEGIMFTLLIYLQNKVLLFHRN